MLRPMVNGKPLAMAAAAAIVGIGCGARTTLGVSHGCGVTAASRDRQIIVYANDKEVVRIKGEIRTRIAASKQNCLGGHPDTLFVYPDGNAALLYGTRSNIDFDLWGHSGRHVSVACRVDFTTYYAGSTAGSGIAAFADESIERLKIITGRSGVTYAWRPNRTGAGLEVVHPSRKPRTVALPLEEDPGPVCEVNDDGEMAFVACTDKYGDKSPTLRIVRYSLASWPPQEVSRATVELAPYDEFWGTTTSPDGSYLAYWGRGGDHGAEGIYGNYWGVVALATGKEVFRKHEEYGGAVSTIEIDPRGTGILVGDWITRGHSHEGRLRRFDMKGNELFSRDFGSSPNALYWSEPDAAWYDDGCDIGKVKLSR